MSFHVFKVSILIVLQPLAKDSFIAHDRNEDFEGGQVEDTFWRAHCDLSSGTISKILVPNERYGYYLSIDTP